MDNIPKEILQGHYASSVDFFCPFRLCCAITLGVYQGPTHHELLELPHTQFEPRTTCYAGLHHLL